MTALSVKAAQAGLLFYQSTKTVMQLQDAHRNRAFWRLILRFVVKLSRCEPFAGGLEILNGFTWRYVARTEHSLARVFFPTRLLIIQNWRNYDRLLSLFGCRLRRGGPEQFCGMLKADIRKAVERNRKTASRRSLRNSISGLIRQ